MISEKIPRNNLFSFAVKKRAIPGVRPAAEPFSVKKMRDICKKVDFRLAFRTALR